RLRVAARDAGPLVEVVALEAGGEQQIGADVQIGAATRPERREQRDAQSDGQRVFPVASHQKNPSEAPAVAPNQTRGVWPTTPRGRAKTAGGAGPRPPR